MPAGPAYRIVALGGSSVECLYLDQAKAWPQLLQQRLSGRGHAPVAWVGNAARRGVTTRHYLLQMRRLLPQYPPIDTVILLIGANDLVLRLGEDTAYDPRFLERPDAERVLASVFLIRPAASGRRRPPWRRLVHPVRRGITNWLATGHLEIPDRRGHFHVSARRRRKSAPVRTTLPDLSSALEEYARNVSAIIEVGRAHRTRLVFATHPALWAHAMPEVLADLLWVGGIGPFMHETEFYSAGALATALDYYNRTLLDTCRRHGIECVDLASRLPRDTRVFYDDVHFNVGGAARVAEIFDDYLAQAAHV